MSDEELSHAQLELGKFILFTLLDGKDWSEVDNPSREIIIEELMKTYRNQVDENERLIEFCGSKDPEGNVLLIAVTKEHFDKYNNSNGDNLSPVE